jgi:hypothetical protein
MAEGLTVRRSVPGRFGGHQAGFRWDGGATAGRLDARRPETAAWLAEEPACRHRDIEGERACTRKAGWSVEHSEDSHTKVTDWTLIHPENVRNPQHPQHPQTAATASHAGVAGTYTGYLRMTSPRPTSTANALATGKPNCLAFNACVLADTGCHHHQDQKPTAAVPTAAASSSWRPPWGSALRVRRADVR